MLSLQDLEVGTFFRFLVDSYFGLSTCVYEVLEKSEIGARVVAVAYVSQDLSVRAFDSESEVFNYDGFIVFDCSKWFKK